MSKQKAINFLYKDWLEYKKYYKNKMGFDMQETFIEYLSREINEYIEVVNGKNKSVKKRYSKWQR
jgi:hypothetical protein